VVPVIKCGPLDYRPPKSGTVVPATAEFAVFDENHLLPSILIHLSHNPTIITSPTPTTHQTDFANMTIDDVIDWLKNLKLTDYSMLIKDHGIDGTVLVSMTDADDWKSLGFTKFGDIRKCILALKK